MTFLEFREAAKADLERPTREAQLRWVFWHADAIGRCEVARAVLKRFEARDWEAHSRALAYVEGETMRQRYTDARPTAELKRAEALLIEEAAAVEVTRMILALLGKAADRIRAGQVSHPTAPKETNGRTPPRIERPVSWASNRIRPEPGKAVYAGVPRVPQGKP